MSAGSFLPSTTTPVIRFPAASTASTIPWRTDAPAACAPANSWRANAPGSNAKSPGAQAASDGALPIAGSFATIWERVSRSIRVPAARCSAIIAAVSSSEDHQRSAPRAAIGKGQSSRSILANASSACNLSANAAWLSEGVLALAPTQPKEEAVALVRQSGACSINVTDAPALDRCQAADAPIMPPPTTITLPFRIARSCLTKMGMCLAGKIVDARRAYSHFDSSDAS